MNNNKWLRQVARTYVQMLHEQASDAVVPFPQAAPWFRIKKGPPSEPRPQEPGPELSAEDEERLYAHNKHMDDYIRKHHSKNPEMMRMMGVEPEPELPSKTAGALTKNIYTA
jgi:hypothetical protein